MNAGIQRLTSERSVRQGFQVFLDMRETPKTVRDPYLNFLSDGCERLRRF